MKTALILPYFGKFNFLFPIWLHSCSYNTNITWFIFTDDKTTYRYPRNVKVYYMSFEEFKNRIQNFYDFTISLNSPYRLCNFKPAYGELFEEYIKDYDAWGYCDNDMIYGNITKNIPNIKSDKFVIGDYGHLTILPNTYECRRLYRYADAYKIAFSTPESLFFDENTFYKILEKHEYRRYSLNIVDLVPRHKHFEFFDNNKKEIINESHCFVWQNGVLERYFYKNKTELHHDEYTYIHFLKRPINIYNIDHTKPIVIIPNKILNIPLIEITPSFLDKVNKKGFFFKYWKNSLKPINLYKRLIYRLYKNKYNRLLINKMNKMVEERMV